MIRFRIKEVAKEKGLSQSKLSRKADVDLTTLRKLYQQPADTNITTETLNRLANALEVDARELFDYTQDD